MEHAPGAFEAASLARMWVVQRVMPARIGLQFPDCLLYFGKTAGRRHGSSKARGGVRYFLAYRRAWTEANVGVANVIDVVCVSAGQSKRNHFCLTPEGLSLECDFLEFFITLQIGPNPGAN